VRAAVATRLDPDDPLAALELRDDWPEPVAGPGQTVVRLAATTVNMHDLWSLQGVGVRPEQLPLVLGCDIVGWDEAGREVMVTGAFGDPDAGEGDETFDPDRSLISEDLPGSFAERTVVPTRNVVAKPAWLTFQETACLNVGWSTTYRMLFTRAEARPGERVLVQGAGGGVATAAIAMARAAGLWVVASSRSAEKRRRARERGAHEVVATGARLRDRVDIVVETVGAATWEHSLRAVRPGGRIVVAGATTGSGVPLDLPRLFYRQVSVIGSTAATRWETVRMLRFLEATGTRPVIDSVHPFAELHRAFLRLQQPDVFGKVVVEVAPP
jgi:NADPH:quinone reductase-like Zn-dependent oxidoreductase